MAANSSIQTTLLQTISETKKNSKTLDTHDDLVTTNIKDIKQLENKVNKNSTTLDTHNDLVTTNITDIKQLENEVNNITSVRTNDWLKIDVSGLSSYSPSDHKILMTTLNLVNKYLKTTVISGVQQTVTLKELDFETSTRWGSYNVSNKIIYIKKDGLLNPNTKASGEPDLPCAIGYDDSNLFISWFFHTIIHLLTCPQMQDNIILVDQSTSSAAPVELYIGPKGLEQYKNCLRLLTSAKDAVGLPDSVIDNLTGFLVTNSSNGAVHTYYGPPVVIDGIEQPVIVGYTMMPYILTCELMQPVLLGIFEDNGYIVNYSSPFVTTDTLPNKYSPTVEILWSDQPSGSPTEVNKTVSDQKASVKKNIRKFNKGVNCECC